MNTIILKNNVKIWISDFQSDFIEDEDSEVSKLYYDYFSNIWQGSIHDLLENFAWEECLECSSIKYDDEQYCCTTCWGAEKQDNIENSYISRHFEKKGNKWVFDDKENVFLRELLKDLFSDYDKYSYILITDK